MSQVRRAYAQNENENKRGDSTRTDAARSRSIERRAARAIKRDTVGGAR